MIGPENSNGGDGSGMDAPVQKPVVVRMLRGAIDSWGPRSVEYPKELPCDFPYIVPVVGPTFNEQCYMAEQGRRADREALRDLAALRQQLERDAFESTSTGEHLDGLVPDVKEPAPVLDTSYIYDRRKAAEEARLVRIDKVVASAVVALAAVLGGGFFVRDCILDSQRDAALAMLGDGVEEGLSPDKTFIVQCEEHKPGDSLELVASDHLDSLNGVMSGLFFHWELDSAYGRVEQYVFLDRDQDLTCFVLFQVEGAAGVDPAE